MRYHAKAIQLEKKKNFKQFLKLQQISIYGCFACECSNYSFFCSLNEIQYKSFNIFIYWYCFLRIIMQRSILSIGRISIELIHLYEFYLSKKIVYAFFFVKIFLIWQYHRFTTIEISEFKCIKLNLIVGNDYYIVWPNKFSSVKYPFR